MVVHLWRKDLATLAGLAVLAAALASLVNAWRLQPLPWRYQSRAERLQAEVGAMANIAAKRSAPALLLPSQLAAHPEAVLIDARPKSFFALGHIPGAVSLPREHFRTAYEAALAVLGADKARPLIVYCQGGECVDSQLVAEALSDIGYQHLWVLYGGYEAWQQEVAP